MSKCKRIGIDIAKQIFQVHGVDEAGKTVLIKKVQQPVMQDPLRVVDSNFLSSRYEWIHQLKARRPDNVVAVALAAKQARILWAMMAKGENWNPYHDQNIKELPVVAA